MGLVDHSGKDHQYLSIKFTERFAKAGIEHSVGSVGCSDAPAETNNMLFKAEVIHPRGPCPNFAEVWYAIIDWLSQPVTTHPLQPRRTTLQFWKLRP